MAHDHGFIPVLPLTLPRPGPSHHARQLSRLRTPVERLSRCLKAWRRIFTRCDKLNMMFVSCITTELIAEIIAESLR